MQAAAAAALQQLPLLLAQHPRVARAVLRGPAGLLLTALQSRSALSQRPLQLQQPDDPQQGLLQEVHSK